jgi:hypothetical protein
MTAAKSCRILRKVLPAVALCITASSVRAQDIPDPAADARIRLGPLALSPTVSMTNAGIDTNVFNEPEEAGPKRDFTITFEPKTDWWLRMGRTWLVGNVREGLVYYNKYASERSTSGLYKLGWMAPLTRVTFDVNGSYLLTRERPGFEIDARAERKELTFDGAMEVRTFSRTFVGIRGERLKVDYDEAAEFLGRSLSAELDRTVTKGAITLRHQLTPLTSLTFDVEREQDRFKFSPLRDADSTSMVAGLKFDPSALLKGSAKFGYRDFEPTESGLPQYRGAVASVDLAYVAAGMTKATIRASRDVQFSYDINQPYYLQTGALGELAQQIAGPLDVVGRIGIAQLEYRDRIGAAVAEADRQDMIHMYGGGVGYHVGRDVRIGFNVDRQSRDSNVQIRRYRGLRYGTSVTYEF